MKTFMAMAGACLALCGCITELSSEAAHIGIVVGEQKAKCSL